MNFLKQNSGHSPTRRPTYLLTYQHTTVRNMPIRLSIALLNILILVTIPSFSQDAQPNTSVLNSGFWYKVAIKSDGIYKLNKTTLSSMGFDVNSLNPKNIRVYGNGGGMLPQSNAIERYHDLVENAIYVNGESDGSFDGNDYVLFYGKGPHTTSFNNEEYGTHSYNLYSESSYYFVTVGDSEGKRITETPEIELSANTFTSFREYKWHEQDLTNLLTSGREWFGENFEFETSHTFDFDVDGLVPNTFLSITASVMAQSVGQATEFPVTVEGKSFTNISVPSAPKTDYGVKAVAVKKTDSLDANEVIGNMLTTKFTYNKKGNQAALGYINYVGVSYDRTLQIYGEQTHFTQPKSTSYATSNYDIKTTDASLKIWNVTTPSVIKSIPYELNSSAIFTDSSSELQRYVAFTGSNFDAPINIGSVSNQNLHGYIESPDLLIVYHPDFRTAAENLAEYKRTAKGLKVETANVFNVYNEFSSGAQDLTAIRDYAKMLYERGDENHNLKWLILFGDASYDYKDRVTNNSNFIPIYESRESLNNIRTYSSDDYFGFLENDEGEWIETGSGNHSLDIGVGRFVVQNIGEANAIVDKIKHYENNNEVLGKWRNEIAFIADDGDGVRHMEDANKLAIMVENSHLEYNVNKIYLDAYEQISSASGEIAPSANAAINNQIEKGALIVNYTGHGGEIGWTQEQILTIPQIESWDNYDRLPFFVTATCEFGRYDDPARESGGELLFKKSGGGAIALVTTARPVYSGSNFKLNTAFYNNCFTPKSDSTMPSIGEILMNTKNNSLTGVDNRNFSLLGDPSLYLAYPGDEIYITHINDQELDSSPDTVSALGKVTIAGEIRNSQGNRIENFQGVLEVKIFDKESEVTTLGNEGASFPFKTLENVIYEGSSSISNGSFNFTFVVPKDISYQLDRGKISLYARNINGYEDANGASKELVIGGTSSIAPIDNSPPEIKLFMDDLTFVNGGNTGKNTTLIAKLFDDNGINTAINGIGHELTAAIDGGKQIIVNDFYEADMDQYQSGTVTFKFRDLSPGNHSITFKAWDTHNNSSESRIDFWVGRDDFSFSNAPNPFQNSTTFFLDHDRAGEDVNVSILIYNDKGQQVGELSETFYDSETIIQELEWNGLNSNNDNRETGVYFCRATLIYVGTGFSTTQVTKTVLID